MGLKARKIDIILNVLYSVGAAIVLLGALFKLTHMTVGPLNGTNMLTIGLITEAFIFLIGAFIPPEGSYKWENAYPELLDAKAVKKSKKIVAEPSVEIAQVSLSQKLDKMLEEAKLDAELMGRLKTGIENFGGTVENINKTVDATASTQQYGDQLALAANHMESLNALYVTQLENGQKQIKSNKTIVDKLEKSAKNAEALQGEFQNLSGNLASLNKVYGGMLTAMNFNK